MPKSFKQKLTLPASPKTVFETLLDSRKHTQFTGAPAFCNKREGGEFTAYNGMISGRNVEILNNKRIVQAWRAKDWPRGVYSIICYQLTRAPDNKCSLEFTHTGIPDASFGKIKDGWNDYYWLPLKQHLREQAKAASKKRTGTKRKSSPRKRRVA